MAHPATEDRLCDLCAPYGLITGVCMSPADLKNDKFRDLARQHARNAAEQHATATIGLLQRGRTSLDRQAAGHLGHRR